MVPSKHYLLPAISRILKPMTAKTELLTSKAYVDDLIKEARAATTRIILFTHIIAYDESTERLIDELCAAAERGVVVEVSGDVYTFGILRGWNTLNSDIRKLRFMIKRLRESKVKYRWIGTFGPFLFAGRTHVKWCIIDGIAYSFGGVNLYSKGIENTDYMLKIPDALLANQLVEEHHKITLHDRNAWLSKSRSFDCSVGTVLLDGGIAFDSIIYRRACELAEKASEILFVSQYCPTGKLGKLMSQKKSKLYFSNYDLASGANRLLIKTSMRKTGYDTLYKKSVYNHAKFIIFTMADGKKTALTGSHNFVWGGVVLGTREINLETTDKHIISQLETFFAHHIA